MSRIMTISWVDIYRRFTDRSAMLLNIVAPLLLSIIIGTALGDAGNNDIEIQEASVGIINLDEGTFGDIYACLLLEKQSTGQKEKCTSALGSESSEGTNEIGKFVNAKTLTDDQDAIQQVENGDLDVVLIIPADFTAQIMAGGQGNLAVHYNAGAGIPADIARSIIDSISNQISTSAIASGVISQVAAEQYGADGQAIGALTLQVQATLFNTSLRDVIAIERQNVKGEAQEFNALQYFAPSMAIFFMTFTMAEGARSILEDRRNWTMQRILSTPTKRWEYLAGKLGGTYVSGIFQMTVLIIAMIIIGNGFMGTDVPIWGTDILGIILVTISVVAAATGMGMVIAAFGKTPDQVQALSTFVLVVLGIVSGTFVDVSNVAVVRDLRKLTLNYWGLDGYYNLSANHDNFVDILPNVGILLLMSVVFFGFAIYRFNRRLDY